MCMKRTKSQCKVISDLGRRYKVSRIRTEMKLLFIYFLDFEKACGILYGIPGVLEYESVILRNKEKTFF